MNNKESDFEKDHRFYIMQTVAGWLIWRVRHRDVEMFMELFGEYVIGCGDTVEEAMGDRDRRKAEEIGKRFDKYIEKALGIQDEVRITIADLHDWIKGKG